ncbi:hypothetical protein HK097_006733, partial [Rhizophlyctis rosea]
MRRDEGSGKDVVGGNVEERNGVDVGSVGTALKGIVDASQAASALERMGSKKVGGDEAPAQAAPVLERKGSKKEEGSGVPARAAPILSERKGVVDVSQAAPVLSRMGTLKKEGSDVTPRPPVEDVSEPAASLQMDESKPEVEAQPASASDEKPTKSGEQEQGAPVSSSETTESVSINISSLPARKAPILASRPAPRLTPPHSKVDRSTPKPTTDQLEPEAQLKEIDTPSETPNLNPSTFTNRKPTPKPLIPTFTTETPDSPVDQRKRLVHRPTNPTPPPRPRTPSPPPVMPEIADETAPVVSVRRAAEFFMKKQEAVAASADALKRRPTPGPGGKFKGFGGR